MMPMSSNLYRPTSYSAEMYEQAIMERNAFRRERDEALAQLDTLRKAVAEIFRFVNEDREPSTASLVVFNILDDIVPNDLWGLSLVQEEPTTEGDKK